MSVLLKFFRNHLKIGDVVIFNDKESTILKINQTEQLVDLEVWEDSFVKVENMKISAKKFHLLKDVPIDHLFIEKDQPISA